MSSGSNMADDSPPILRPVPRRPFSLNLVSATPPLDDADAPDAAPDWESAPPDPASSPRFLGAAFSPADPASISRPESLLNLTSSTLMGIYSQTSPSARDRAPLLADRDDDTPWGTGAHTPVRRPSVDDATYELMRRRARPRRVPPSYPPANTAAPPSSAPATASSLTLRAGLLFLLGVGYGVLVSRLHSEQQYLAGLAEGIIKPGTNWRYLAFWGASGVVLGSLLPWFDKVWEDTFGSELEDDSAAGAGGACVSKDLALGTDWALVMRAIGAFVGIVFAIRKVAWASTLQVSATLALVNPLLWWLIDRSKPGLLLAAAVGLTGSMLLLGVNPEMMPAPSRGPSNAAIARNASSSSDGALPPVLGGLASQETVETGVWMLSVLFCSCVCFGNIGRRLTWSRRAVGRGRWGGLR